MRRSRLDVVLRLARAEERQALVALAGVRRRIAELDARRDGLIAARAHTRSELAIRDQVDASWLHLRTGYLGVVASQLPELETRLEQARGEEGGAREELARRRLRVRAIEGSMQRRAARARTERLRREERRLDDRVREARAREEAGDALV